MDLPTFAGSRVGRTVGTVPGLIALTVAALMTGLGVAGWGTGDSVKNKHKTPTAPMHMHPAIAAAAMTAIVHVSKRRG
jgi:hypothetical protein